MPRKPKSLTSEAPLAPISTEILDQFVRQGPLTPEELDSAVRRFKKAMIERALGAELSHHLGDVPGGTRPEDTTNHRNGSSGKTVLTDDGYKLSISCGHFAWESSCCCCWRTTEPKASIHSPLHRERFLWTQCD
jgi:hypothetical protein